MYWATLGDESKESIWKYLKVFIILSDKISKISDKQMKEIIIRMRTR